jgi:hypothetical protein
MSQFKAIGFRPKDGSQVDILFGYDEVPGFKAGYFFQVYLPSGHPEFRDESENCILNKGLLNGISKNELDELFKEWKVKEKRPINQRCWITV